MFRLGTILLTENTTGWRSQVENDTPFPRHLVVPGKEEWGFRAFLTGRTGLSPFFIWCAGIKYILICWDKDIEPTG